MVEEKERGMFERCFSRCMQKCEERVTPFPKPLRKDKSGEHKSNEQCCPQWATCEGEERATDSVCAGFFVPFPKKEQKESLSAEEE